MRTLARLFRPCLILPLPLLLAAPPLHAARQNLEDIYRAAGAFIQNHLPADQAGSRFNVGRLENRLYLPQCTRLEAFLPPGAALAGKTRIGVQCLHPTEWVVIVPASIHAITKILTLTRSIPSGQALGIDDLALKPLAPSEPVPPRTLTRIEQAIGKIAVVSLGRGISLRTDMLREPNVIMQNQTVSLIAEGDGFSVSNDGVALGNAAAGQPVQVRSRSGRILRGIARAPGIVVLENNLMDNNNIKNSAKEFQPAAD